MSAIRAEFRTLARGTLPLGIFFHHRRSASSTPPPRGSRPHHRELGGLLSPWVDVFCSTCVSAVPSTARHDASPPRNATPPSTARDRIQLVEVAEVRSLCEFTSGAQAAAEPREQRAEDVASTVARRDAREARHFFVATEQVPPHTVRRHRIDVPVATIRAEHGHRLLKSAVIGSLPVAIQRSPPATFSKLTVWSFVVAHDAAIQQQPTR
jgi:hypothetical protein